MTLRITFVALITFLAQTIAGQQPGLLVRNAQVLDGTGAQPRRADVRVAVDAISEIESSLMPRAGERVSDAGGKVLAPGFIDMHSHADRGLDETPDAESQVRQ